MTEKREGTVKVVIKHGENEDAAIKRRLSRQIDKLSKIGQIVWKIKKREPHNHCKTCLTIHWYLVEKA